MRKILKLAVISLLILQVPPPVFAEEGFLTAADGTRLFYDYRKADPAKGAILFLHGWGMSCNEWDDLEKAFFADGWSTLAIDFRGHGASIEQEDHQLDYREFGPSDLLKMQTLDIAAAVQFLTDTRPIWLIGASFGADLALGYASQKHEIQGAVLLSPVMKIRDEDYKRMMERYENRPLLMVASQNDAAAFETASKLDSYAEGNTRFLRYQTAGHGTAMLKSAPELKDHILQWLNSTAEK